jgi:hypothetical protein
MCPFLPRDPMLRHRPFEFISAAAFKGAISLKM